MNLISLGASRPHHPRCSVAHLVTKPRYETCVTKPVTKPLFFHPTLFKALRNRYETPQNPMFRNKRVEGVA
mgnify:CR=1 FL=1